MNSRPSSWAPPQLYWRTEREPNCREDLEAGKQELGHGKQRRLKAQYLWDIPESDVVSKSAQSAPGSYFQNTGVPHHHSAITLNMAGAARSHSAVALRTLMSSSHSVVISKTLMSSSHSAVTSKNADVVSVARRLPLKCRRRHKSLSSLPLKALARSSVIPTPTWLRHHSDAISKA
jgi:hypothetical protein